MPGVDLGGVHRHRAVDEDRHLGDLPRLHEAPENQRDLLGAPATHGLAAVVMLGLPERQVTKLTRRPVEDFATIDRYDGPPLTAAP